MELKHTPEPWENRNGRIFVKGTSKAIADVLVQKNYEDVTFKPIEDVEAKANAQLIKASPKLLKALMILEAGLRKDVDMYTRKEKLAIAQEAIKEATEF